MPRPAHAETGYILLMVMWLLVLGGAVAAATLAVALAGARSANAIETDLRHDMLVRSAVDQIIHDLARDGLTSVWLRGPRVMGESGFAMTARVTPEAGRLDLLSAPRQQIEQFLAGQHKGAVVAARIGRSAIGPAGLVGLARRSADWPAGRDCLLDAITLYSGLPAPVAAGAGPSGDTSPGGDDAEARSAVGEAFRIELLEAGADGPSRRLVVIVRLTGSEVTPFWIHDWFWTASSRCGIAEVIRVGG